MFPYLSISQLSIGPVTVQTWGFFATLGFIAALWISLRAASRNNIEREIIWDVMIISLFGTIAGSRIFYFFSISNKSIDMLFNPHAGFSLLGGVVAAGTLSLIYLKIKKQDFRRVFDALTPGVAVSLIFVRTGCLLISDHAGRATAIPWGAHFFDGSVRHPVALYHIFFLLLILLIIFRLRSERLKDGLLFFYFCIFYAAFIFIADLFRCDDLPVCDVRFNYLTLTQWALLVFLFLSPFARRLFMSGKS